MLQSINDLFIGNCTGTTGNGIAFTPPYKYTVESTAGLKEKIEAGAGATLGKPETSTPTPTPTPISIIYGDLNSDGKTNSTDYALMKRFLLDSISLTNEQIKAADVNLDGKVNSTDYAVLKRFILGSIISLPYNGTATYQAEDAVFSRAIFEAKNAGYTGTGYVNYDNVPGGYIEWTVNMANAGTYTLTLTYANGTSSNRTVDVSVNGNVVASNVVFGGTGAWTQWQTKSITASLNSGVNKIRVTATSSDGGPNIDKLEITQN
ncbi:dockerin type I domain-containing protein [Acetivibrio straminisolvens]|uniref:Pectate lyase n=1 Tax=Acetivibrio straminisolvens JCM 21531 TaxID=1294263 RepID=W4VB63_9FIRM|nr:dockerin type I domain-containing protein [Acetivibrio straminisolvens]GAE89984.1 pectate lyase precursor [Acetivibrio straminisolvens JCM 21531]